jgi:hypothetical protein
MVNNQFPLKLSSASKLSTGGHQSDAAFRVAVATARR